MIAMFAFGMNVISNIILKGVFAEALSFSGYSNEFSGSIITIACISSIIGSFVSPFLDRNFDYIRVSRIVSLVVGVSFSVHYMSQLMPNLQILIQLSNVVLSLSLSILIPLQLQAMLRPSKGLLPDASVASLNAFISVICYGLLTAILLPTKKISVKYSSEKNIYFLSYVCFSIVVLVTNLLYAFVFQPPIRNENAQLDKIQPNKTDSMVENGQTRDSLTHQDKK